MSRSTVRCAFLVLGGAFAVACAGGASSPTSPSSTASSTPTGTGVTTYTYTANVRSILTTDCTWCHNASQHDGGYDFTTFTGVRRALTVGSAGSPLVRQTQPGGLMFSELSGDRTAKSGVIYDWVVNSGAVE